MFFLTESFALLTVVICSNLFHSCHLDRQDLRLSLWTLTHRCTPHVAQRNLLRLWCCPEPHKANIYDVQYAVVDRVEVEA